MSQIKKKAKDVRGNQSIIDTMKDVEILPYPDVDKVLRRCGYRTRKVLGIKRVNSSKQVKAIE